MELACHVRDSDKLDRLHELSEHLLSLYEEKSIKGEWLKNIPQKIDRIYIGDEFCINRLPSLSQVDGFLDFTEKRISKSGA